MQLTSAANLVSLIFMICVNKYIVILTMFRFFTLSSESISLSCKKSSRWLQMPFAALITWSKPKNVLNYKICAFFYYLLFLCALKCLFVLYCGHYITHKSPILYVFVSKHVIAQHPIFQ